MKLYTRWQNSAGERVRIALHLKGIAYDYVSVGSLSRAAYLAINPQGLMPTLEVDGCFIAQSPAILDYVERAYPQPALLPEDPMLRAEALAFAAHIASEMHAITVNRVRKFLETDLSVGADGVDRWVRHWLQLGFAALETTLEGRERDWPFCFTETPGWADLHLVPQMANGRRLGIDLSAYPHLLAVEARCVDLDAFRRARPDQQPDYPGVAR